jgi:hypothetical protein
MSESKEGRRREKDRSIGRYIFFIGALRVDGVVQVQVERIKIKTDDGQTLLTNFHRDF